MLDPLAQRLGSARVQFNHPTLAALNQKDICLYTQIPALAFVAVMGVVEKMCYIYLSFVRYTDIVVFIRRVVDL